MIAALLWNLHAPIRCDDVNAHRQRCEVVA